MADKASDTGQQPIAPAKEAASTVPQQPPKDTPAPAPAQDADDVPDPDEDDLDDLAITNEESDEDDENSEDDDLDPIMAERRRRAKKQDHLRRSAGEPVKPEVKEVYKLQESFGMMLREVLAY